MRRATVTLLAAVLACGLVACGGDDASDKTDRADAAQATTDRADAEPGAGQAAAPQPSANEATADGVTPPGGPEKMLGGFGRAPTAAERAAITAAVARYHRAVAADDDARICAQMSRARKRAVSRNAGGAGSCVDQIDPFYSGFSDAIRKALLRARITELRVEGDHAVVIGFIPGPRTIKLAMDREQGTWRYGDFGRWAPPSL